MSKRTMGEKPLKKVCTDMECKGDQGDNITDRISMLPDELLQSILSLLTLEEAARTSILSHRWKDLGTNFHKNLVFSNKGLNTKLKGNKWYNALLKLEREKYVRRVNKVLQLHRGSTIDEFKVHFDLRAGAKCHINRWLEFLSNKGIKSLELDFTSFTEEIVPPGLAPISLEPLFPACFSSLRSLSLKFMKVTMDILEVILRGCLLLEKLQLEGLNIKGVSSLKVPSSLLCLKYLSIKFCAFKRLKVDAPNLSTLKIFDWKTKIILGVLPQLTNVSIKPGSRCGHVSFALESLSSVLPQLMELYLCADISKTNPQEAPPLPHVANLKYLTLEIVGRGNDDILDCATWVLSLPVLEMLRMKFVLFENIPDLQLRIPRRSPHNSCLKIVELCGFRGYIIDYEFALYLLENAVGLQKLVINLNNVYRSSVEPSEELIERELKERRIGAEQAMTLAEHLSEGVEFELIGASMLCLATG